ARWPQQPCGDKPPSLAERRRWCWNKSPPQDAARGIWTSEQPPPHFARVRVDRRECPPALRQFRRTCPPKFERREQDSRFVRRTQRSADRHIWPNRKAPYLLWPAQRATFLASSDTPRC